MAQKSGEIHAIKASPLAIWAGMITIYLVWGSTYLAIRFAVVTIPPFGMAGVRFLIAGIILYGIRRIMGDPTPTRVEWFSAAIIGFFLIIGGNGGVVWAEQRISSGLAALIIGTVPLWMVLIEAIKNKGQLPPWQALVGVITGFIGILLLFWPDPNTIGIGSIDFWGAFVIVLASVSWAYGSLYSRKASLPKSPLMGTSMEMLAGGAGLMVVSLVSGEPGRLNLNGISSLSLMSFLYLILFGSLIGFTTYTWLLRAAPTPLVSTYAYINPLVAIVIGFLFAGEILAPRSILSAVIILGSVILATVGNGYRTTNTKRAKRSPGID